MLQQDLRNKAILDRNKARGRPGLDDGAARVAHITVSGQSVGRAPDEMRKTVTGKVEAIAQEACPGSREQSHPGA